MQDQAQAQQNVGIDPSLQLESIARQVGENATAAAVRIATLEALLGQQGAMVVELRHAIAERDEVVATLHEQIAAALEPREPIVSN